MALSCLSELCLDPAKIENISCTDYHDRNDDASS